MSHAGFPKVNFKETVSFLTLKLMDFLILVKDFYACMRMYLMIMVFNTLERDNEIKYATYGGQNVTIPVRVFFKYSEKQTTKELVKYISKFLGIQSYSLEKAQNIHLIAWGVQAPDYMLISPAENKFSLIYKEGNSFQTRSTSILFNIISANQINYMINQITQ